MATLLTCGTGKTASHIAQKLSERNLPVILCSRRGQAGIPLRYTGVAFDWLDFSTFRNPFTLGIKIRRVYLIPPPACPDAVELVKDFIDICCENGVERIVLMSASMVDRTDPGWGEMQEYLEEHELDYCVLKPSLFFENFIETLAPSIRDDDVIVTATGEKGSLAFVSADDVAEVAIKCLTDVHSHRREHLIFGPELLSYDEVAAQLSQVLGRQISHEKVSIGERIQGLIEKGLSEAFARGMASMEAYYIGSGREGKLYASTECKSVGKTSLRHFLEKHKDHWSKDRLLQTPPPSPSKKREGL